MLVKAQFCTAIGLAEKYLKKNLLDDVTKITFDHKFNIASYLEQDILICDANKDHWLAPNLGDIPALLLINFERDASEIFIEYLFTAVEVQYNGEDLEWANEESKKRFEEWLDIENDCFGQFRQMETDDDRILSKIFHESMKKYIRKILKVKPQITLAEIIGDRKLDPNKLQFSGFCVRSPIKPEEIYEIKIGAFNYKKRYKTICIYKKQDKKGEK